MDLGLDGRGCVVTGASRGIGLEVARRLAAEGASVLLVARGADQLEKASNSCRGQVAHLALDVTDPDAGARILEDCTRRFGQLDVVVNNAGTASWRPLEEVPDEDWYAAWELNVMAPLRIMRAAIPAMRERRYGRIVNVASTAGKRPTLTMPEYSVAKAAQLSLSRLHADLYAAEGVLVNAVAPGPARSELWMEPGGLLDQSAAATKAPSREAAEKAMGEKRPIGRLAEPGEIADAIVFLCSERASYVSGAAWAVDGGTVQVII
jgi:3-oxoacyl-[acyl-carrier protein] reductase